MYHKLLQSMCVLRHLFFYGVLFQVLAISVAFGQTKVVTGKVTSTEDNVALPGTSIVIKGTTVGTVTDAEGNYSLEVQSPDAILVFSSIGYTSEEITVGTQSTINIGLTTDITQLQEVVVVGYGTVKKSDVTGALSRITAETIMERPVQNAVQALQGRIAGMHVLTNIKPGETPSVTIRGNRSIQASNDPLYVVDGIPIVNMLGVNSFSINDISPNDIASIEVLKDASATAIYGSRGANGVILITTKKGSNGKVDVSYNATYSLDTYRELTDWLDAGEYVDRVRLGLINGRNYQATTNTDLKVPAAMWYPDPVLDRQKMGLDNDLKARESVLMGYEWEDFVGGTVRTRPTTAEEQAMGWPADVPIYNSKNVRNYDWREAALRTGVTQNHQIALSSGTETSRLYLSLAYYDQLGVQKDQDYKRYTANISGDITPNKWLTLGTSIMGSFSLQNFGINANQANTGSKDLYSRAIDQFPYAVPKNDNGLDIRNPGGNLSLWNPLIDLDQVVNERRSTAVLSNIFTEVKFAPWLKYRLNFGAQVRQFRNGAWTGPLATSHLTNRPNTAGYNTDQAFSWVAENLLYFDKTFADVHQVGVTLLQSSQKSRRESVNANVSSTVYDVSYWYDLAANTVGRPDGYGSSYTENTLSSYMGRVNYTLMNKYLLTASARYDGASVLAPGHKWEFFPSFALAWKMHEESFLSRFDWIDEFKPRFGFGVTGNSSVNPYTTTGPLSRNPYAFGATPAVGFLPQLVKNPDLGWEKTSQWNLGVDYSFLKGRISGAVEIYESNTSDLILTRDLPGVSGYVQKVENVGKTRNQGVEVTLTAIPIEKGDFSWTAEINFGANREKIIELQNGKEDMLAARLFIGHPTQVYYHLEYAGIWQNTEEDLAEMALFNAAPGNHRFHPGSIRVVDQNGDYRITADDYTILGSNRPQWTGGMTNTFKYKNWSLSSFIYTRVGQTYFGGPRVERDYWTWDNPNGRFPMPNAGNVESIPAAIQYYDGTFAIVRNISLSYAFPNTWMDRIGIKNLELSAQVLNPFIIGKDLVKLGINPDDVTNWDNQSQPNSNNTVPTGGMNNNSILPQSLVFGLRASF